LEPPDTGVALVGESNKSCRTFDPKSGGFSIEGGTGGG
jgi:hypothetical protein